MICGLQLGGQAFLIVIYFVFAPGYNMLLWSVGLVCLVQAAAFALTEAVVIGFMKDVPQELTIAFNLGKGTGHTLEIVCSVAFLMAGPWTIAFAFAISPLPIVTYMFGEWFCFVMQSHTAHLNIYKVLETDERVGDESLEELQDIRKSKESATDHIPFMRMQTQLSKKNIKGLVNMLSIEEDKISQVEEPEKVIEP